MNFAPSSMRKGRQHRASAFCIGGPPQTKTLGLNEQVLISLDYAKTTAIASFALFAFGSTAHAVTCNMLQYNLDEARTQLRRAADESDLEDAKDYARRARNALDDAAMSAMDCKCLIAQSELDTAVSRARNARDTDRATDFVDSLNRAIRAFNSALKALRMCTSQRR